MNEAVLVGAVWAARRAAPVNSAAPVASAEPIAARTLALPFHNNLTDEQVDRVVDALAKAVGHGI